MARKTKKSKAQINKQLWDRANTSQRVKWQTTSQKGYDFYLNEHLTKDEKETLQESGMPTFIVNRITPIVEIMKYFVTANNPRWKAVGVTGDDVDVAQVHSDIADYCWHLSNGKSIYSQVVLDSLTKGIGYFMINIDKDADRGMGEVMFNRVDPYDVFVDPASTDFLFRDAAFIQVRKNIARSVLINMFPEHSAKIKRAAGNAENTRYSQRDIDQSESIQPEDITLGITVGAEDDDILPLYETYNKKKFPYRNVFIKVLPSPQQMVKIKQQVEEQIKDLEKETQVSLQEKQLQIQQAVEAGEMIPDRAQLEIERAQKMATQALEEQKAILTAQAQDAASKIENRIMSEEAYKIIKDGEMSKQIIDAIKFYENRIVVTCSVGDDVLLYEHTLPVSEYPIIPISYMYTGTPYPMSAIVPLIGKQQEINKAHQIMLHNANLASNLRWMYEEGSVPEEEWERYSSAPGALLKYRQGFNAPTPVMPAPINNAFFSVVQEGKGDAEYIAGVPSAMM